MSLNKVKDRLHARLDFEARYKKRTGKVYSRILYQPTATELKVMAFLKEC